MLKDRLFIHFFVNWEGRGIGCRPACICRKWGKPQTLHRQDSQFMDRGSHPGPPRYENMLITRPPRRLISLYCLYV
jgi:hypothetical protein